MTFLHHTHLSRIALVFTMVLAIYPLPIGAKSLEEQLEAAEMCIELSKDVSTKYQAFEIGGEIIKNGGRAYEIHEGAIEASAQCILAVRGPDYTFFDGRFMRKFQVQDLNRENAEELISRVLISLQNRHDDRNSQLVRNGIREACVASYRADSTQAFLNPICVASFEKFGHPDLERLEVFAAEEMPKVLQRIIELYETPPISLDEYRFQRICKEENSFICEYLVEIGQLEVVD